MMQPVVVVVVGKVTTSRFDGSCEIQRSQSEMPKIGVFGLNDRIK
jgi:hypothetical protein